jgi:hypothetical protein
MAADDPLRFPRVGRCVYCGADGRPEGLREEHIIALSLGRNAILPEASCRQCECVTSYIEGACARGMFGRLRIQHGFPTRRPKDRPTHLAADYEFETHIEEHSLPSAASPFALATYSFGPPGILTGAPPSECWSKSGIFMAASKQVEKRGAKRVRLNLPKLSTGVFARMLAKIAHSYAVAALGSDIFAPLLPEIILNRFPHIPYLVGGELKTYPASVGVCHELRIETVNIENRRFVITMIRLFSYLGAPVYTVVVGKIPPDCHIDNTRLPGLRISITQGR